MLVWKNGRGMCTAGLMTWMELTQKFYGSRREKVVGLYFRSGWLPTFWHGIE